MVRVRVRARVRVGVRVRAGRVSLRRRRYLPYTSPIPPLYLPYTSYTRIHRAAAGEVTRYVLKARSRITHCEPVYL